MAKQIAAFFSAAVMLLGTPALAATPFALPDGKDWIHANTGFKIPAKAGGFTRDTASDFGTTKSDIIFQYAEQSSKTVLTLYLFRAGAPDVSVWADRAEGSIVSNAEHYGQLGQAGRLWSRLSPWQNAKDSALLIVLPVSGQNAKATGVVVARHGDWLIKLRMTSATMSTEQLGARLAGFLAALKLPKPRKEVLPAYAIQPCADALPATEAKLIPADDNKAIFNSAILNSALPGAVVSAKGGGASAAAIYCRDSASQQGYGVYRPDGTRDSYLIAAGDGGASIMVGKDLAGALSKPQKDQFSATFLTNDRAIGLFPYQSLPSPRQVMTSLEKAKPIYVRSRVPGEEKALKILVPAPGKED